MVLKMKVTEFLTEAAKRMGLIDSAGAVDLTAYPTLLQQVRLADIVQNQIINAKGQEFLPSAIETNGQSLDELIISDSEVYTCGLYGLMYYLGMNIGISNNELADYKRQYDKALAGIGCVKSEVEDVYRGCYY